MTSTITTATPSARRSAASASGSAALTRRASLTAVALLLDYATRLGAGLIVTPLLLGYLGRSLFGSWEIVLRLASYASAADGRPMDTLRLVLASQQGQADADARRRTVGMAIGVWGLFLPAIVVTGGVIAWWAPALTRVPDSHVLTIRLTAALLVLNLVLATLVALPEAVLFGVNQGYRRMGLVATAHLAGAALVAAVIALDLGLVGLALAQVALTLGTALLFLRLVRVYVPWFGAARPTPAELRWFAGLSGWSVAGDAVAKVLLASDVVILGLLASAAAVTSYVITGYAAQAVVSVLTLVLGAAVPGLADIIGQKDHARAAALRAELLALGWLGATAAGGAILLWNRSFLDLWVGAGHYAGFWPNALLVAVMVQTVLIRSDACVINAMLRLRARVLASAVAAVLTCALAALLVVPFGITGLCLSVVIGRLVQSIAFPIVVNAGLGRVSGSGLIAGIRPAAVTLLLFAACAVLEPRLHVATWPGWALGVTASVSVILPAALVTGLAADDRHRVWRRVQGLRQGRGALA